MALIRRGPDALPPIGYAYPAGTPLPYPERFTPVANLADLNRPEHGLWCSPVSCWNDDGTPRATAWTHWCAHPDDIPGEPHLHHDTGTTYSEIVRVAPLPGARIYRIDTTSDLDDLVAAYRLPEQAPMYRTAPDWEMLAADGFDAVYASAEGITANEQRWVTVEPSLSGWECASVLWLHPAYRLVGV